MLKRFEFIKAGKRKRICAAALTVILTLGGLQINTTEAFAATDKTKDNTTLGTWSIPSPTAPSTDEEIRTDQWKGSKVYFGKYNNTPVLYRVLSPDGKKNTYGSDKMLLDCDSILFRDKFRDFPDTEEPLGKNKWSESDIKAQLNGGDFYENDSRFSAAERNAIAISRGKDKVSRDGLYIQNWFRSYTPADAHVFLLEVQDVLNTDYGYPRDDGWNPNKHSVTSREKRDASGSNGYWWLRSPVQEGAWVGDIGGDYFGMITQCLSREESGVSPAFNVDLSSVIFSTEVERSTYKLTIKDSSMRVEAGKAEKADNTVTVPVQVTGGSRLSLLFTDKILDNKNAKIKEYKAVTVSDNKVSFDLPDGYSPYWRAYLLTEELNGDQETDYASAPCRIRIPGEKEDDEKDEDNGEDEHEHKHEEHKTASWILNPNEKQQLVIKFTGTPVGLTAGWQEQGQVAQALFTEAMPKGWKKAFSFNLLNKERKPETSLKSGKLIFNIPAEYLCTSVSAGNAGRQFAILAMDKNGKVYVLNDTDTDPATVTVNVNFEGYAMNLIYRD